MQISNFRTKLKELHEKSGMDVFLDWPIVYDIDEDGKMYVSENGRIFFADKQHNWIESPYSLDGIKNIKFAKAFEEGGIDNTEEVSESYIYIYFASGDTLTLFNRHDTYQVDIWVNFHEKDEDKDLMNKLVELCNSKSVSFSKYQ